MYGEEPKDEQILEFICNSLNRIIDKQTEYFESDNIEIKKISPKRLKKLAARELKKNPLSSKSQEAIQKQLEVDKKQKKVESKELKEQIENYKRQKAVEKKKNKHKGR